MAAEHQDLTFSCPSCGNEFTWEPRFAGRRLSCPCGQVVVGPTRQQILAPSTPAEPPPREAPARAESLASIYGAPRRRIVEDDDQDAGGWLRNILLPLIVLAVALLILATQVRWTRPPVPERIDLPPGRMIAILFVMIVATLAAAAVGAKFMNIDFGRLDLAVFKLCTIPILAAALAIPIIKFDKDPHGLTGPAMGWSIMILVYWILLGVLFKLELTETLLLTFVVAVAQAVLLGAVLS